MTDIVERLWVPSQEQILGSNIVALEKKLGVGNYDALYRKSLEEPEAYWREVLSYCQVVWSRQFENYANFPRGPEFPQWFVGGELNWTDSVLAWADRPETEGQNAVAAERESGEIAALTFAELKATVRSFAAGLQNAGIARGDRVGLLMESGIEATVSLLALSYIGAIMVPLFSGFGAEAIVSRMESCAAKALIATSGFHRRGKLVDTTQAVFEAKARLPALETLILKGRAGTSASGILDWSELAATPAKGTAAARMSPNDPFMVIFTSGTTGKPKGAVHTHGGFPLKVVHDSAIHLDARPGDVFLWPVDMGWVGGAMVIGCSLLRGATLVCYDGAPDFPDWSRMSCIIGRHGVTHFGAAPTLIRGLAANADIATLGDVSSVRILVTAGEAIDPETFLWHEQHFGGGQAPLINFTGGTEASGALLSSVIVKPIRPAGFNTVAPGVDVAIVTSNGKPILDEVGELAIRRPFVGMTHSFWGDDERYLDTYWRAVPGLWIHGDLALQTGDGHFFMRGRSDDTLKLAGKRLGPAEVEDVALEIEQVTEAAAIGIDDAAKGQKLVVFVVVDAAEDTHPHLEETVALHIERRLGRPFRPSRVHIVRDLPKTRTTKVMRRMIRSAYSGLPVGDTTALANPTALDEVAAAAKA